MSGELAGWNTDARVMVGTAGHWLRWCNQPALYQPGVRQVRLENHAGVLVGIIAEAPNAGLPPIDPNIVATAIISGTVMALIDRDMHPDPDSSAPLAAVRRIDTTKGETDADPT